MSSTRSSRSSSISSLCSDSSISVIDLSSDNPNLTDDAESSNGSGCGHIDSNDQTVDQVDSELKLVGEICKQSNTQEQRVQKRKALQELQPNMLVNERVKVTPSTSLSVLNTIPTETEGTRELKSKLEMVTAELSRSRMELAKRLKRTTVREQMTIEVLDFPIEYYNQIPAAVKSQNGEPQYWFQLLNRSLPFLMPPEYSAWIKARTTEFLPEVLKIMTTVWNNNTPTASKFSGSDLLNCRLVSKSWKRSVDKLIQEPSWHDTSPMISTKLGTGDLGQIERLERFQAYQFTNPFSVLYPHPFPTRSFIFTVSRDGDSKHAKSVFAAIKNLLRWYGQDIEHFVYHNHEEIAHNFVDPDYTILKIWRTLRRWLAKMPNLRALELYLPQIAEAASLEDVAVVSPTFPKLLLFKCEHVPDFLINSVFGNNKNIEKLNYCQLHATWVDTPGQLTNVSELALNVLKRGHILPPGQMNWPLRKLTLSTSVTYQDVIDLKSLFTSLESFQETLQELQLTLWNTAAGSEKKLRLWLPQLKKLRLFLMENSKQDKISYDFLLPLSQLEMLSISARETDKVVQGVQVIWLQGYLHRMYESNIWDLFPYLKKVETIAWFEDGSFREFQYCRDGLPK